MMMFCHETCYSTFHKVLETYPSNVNKTHRLMSAYVHPEYHHHLHAIALSYAMYLDIYPKAKTTKMFASDPSLGSVSKQNQPRMQVFFLLPSKSPPEDASAITTRKKRGLPLSMYTLFQEAHIPCSSK